MVAVISVEINFYTKEKFEADTDGILKSIKRNPKLNEHPTKYRNHIRSWYLSGLAHGMELVAPDVQPLLERLYETPTPEQRLNIRRMFTAIRGNVRGKYDPRCETIAAVFENSEEVTVEHEANLHKFLYNRHVLRAEMKDPDTDRGYVSVAKRVVKQQDAFATEAAERLEADYKEFIAGREGVSIHTVGAFQCSTVLSDPGEPVEMCGKRVEPNSRHKFCPECSKKFLTPAKKMVKESDQGRYFILQKLSRAA